MPVKIRLFSMGDHLFLHYAKSKPFDRRKISSKRFGGGKF
ncbi:hypothetical protein B4135_3387 [Caldibacillus debilis]|uniref:Uncharacterized protein n=1 Tax=Caldibacillus debilis TaxID=301148 RepID=A0A150LF68_9BACI|nr:hypothetical protein B4135_3387 [Caldibacillus debilis]